MSFYSTNVKQQVFQIIGFLLALGFVIITLWNTYKLIQRIDDDEKKQMELWGLAQQNFTSNNDLDKPIDPLTFKILTSNNRIPMIVVDNKNSLLFSNNINQKKLAQDSIGYIEKLIQKFSSSHQPIEIMYKDSLYQKMYYNNSKIINQLRYYPISFLIIIIFIGVIVFAYYNTSKQSLENKLWNGMAKETAHQLGTPISSLLGWLTILENNVDEKTLKQMKSDVNRLETISARFSKIGSLPNRKKTKISDLVKDIVDYMQIRMPKDITLDVYSDKHEQQVKVNSELIAWVLENLIKNSIDSIRGKGSIKIYLNWDSSASIIIKDSGNGIRKKFQKKIFNPGVTTKRRGWGLGLALAKRIVEKYHDGSIKLIKSTEKGTTFEMKIPID